METALKGTDNHNPCIKFIHSNNRKETISIPVIIFFWGRRKELSDTTTDTISLKILMIWGMYLNNVIFNDLKNFTFENLQCLNIDTKHIKKFDQKKKKKLLQRQTLSFWQFKLSSRKLGQLISAHLYFSFIFRYFLSTCKLKLIQLNFSLRFCGWFVCFLCGLRLTCSSIDENQSGVGLNFVLNFV